MLALIDLPTYIARTTRGLATVTYLDPYLFFAQASTLINNFSLDSNTQIDIHPSAIVDKSVVLKKGQAT